MRERSKVTQLKVKQVREREPELHNWKRSKWEREPVVEGVSGVREAREGLQRTQ